VLIKAALGKTCNGYVSFNQTVDAKQIKKIILGPAPEVLKKTFPKPFCYISNKSPKTTYKSVTNYQEKTELEFPLHIDTQTSSKVCLCKLKIPNKSVKLGKFLKTEQHLLTSTCK